MDPAVANKLKENVPEIQAFMEYIKDEIRKLDTVQGLSHLSSPVDKAVEVTGRERAMQILVNILSPLVDSQVFDKAEEKEYAVEV